MQPGTGNAEPSAETGCPDTFDRGLRMSSSARFASMSDFRLSTSDFDFSTVHMARALELAERGRGRVEPNPMVGCVIADDDGQVVGEGFHTRFGAAHAEVEAIAVAGRRARGATMFVTLEPCCHTGKTPPCTQAIKEAGVKRVVAAMRDPFSQVSGGGFAELRAAGVEVAEGLLEADARALNAPYLKLLQVGRPWIIAKWAMTVDGRLATRTGDSKWISSEASRKLVHQLRGQMDAIIVGRATALADDPLLTARPPGPRAATRIVIDSAASLLSASQLVRTARDVPTMVAVAETAPQSEQSRLRAAGCEVLVVPGVDHATRLASLLDELGRRRTTNVLVEGGAKLLGSFFDLQAVDEVHVFVAPKLVGGDIAIAPIGGIGIDRMDEALQIEQPQVSTVGGDVYIRGRIKR